MAHMLKKQLSVQLSSEGSVESGVGVSEKGRREHRSHTLAGVDVRELRSYQVSKQSREPSSPLKRFSKAKDDISDAFCKLKDRLLDTQQFMSQVHKDSECKPLTVLIKRTEGIADILRRDHMKVAFFGRTSNGKSTVINSLLRETVLPAGIGHTTNCFCSVVGVDESEGYLVPPNSQERQNVKNVKQLAHSLHKERLDPNSLVQIFWPKAKCPLLSGEVELMDSPGIDMDPDLDQWINQYCLDADVFVLVSNAESTLMTAEKKFFHRVSERLSKPNIFILNNRWDCSAQEERSMMEEVKKQHLDADVNFLSRELAVVDENTAKDRVFFVSAKEVLQERTKRPESTVMEEGAGMPNGWKVRMMDFERFEKLFKLCISSSAIHTKFEQHYKKGCEVVAELNQLLVQELQDLANTVGELEVKLGEDKERKEFLSREGNAMCSASEREVSAAAGEVEKKLAVAMQDMESRLSGLVKGFHQEDFNPAQLHAYQEKLCEFMDEKMSQMLETVSGSLGRVHDEAKGTIIENYQSDLKVPLPDVTRLYQLVNPPQPSFAIKCSSLCEDFTAHPKFDFFRSLGLYNKRLQKSLNIEPVLGGVTSRLSQLWSFFPTEYAVPIVLLGGALLLPKVINWRVWLVSVSAYAGLYTWKWSTHDPETAVKEQVVAHVLSKSKDMRTVTCKHYSEQVERGLKIVLDDLQTQLQQETQMVQASIAQCSTRLLELKKFQTNGKNLKNNILLTKENFEEFKLDHLALD